MSNTNTDTTPPDLQPFYLTFGTNYDDGSHPTLPSANSKGFLTIMADSMSSARSKAFERLGPKFAFIYDQQSFDTTSYPHGSIATI